MKKKKLISWLLECTGDYIARPAKALGGVLLEVKDYQVTDHLPNSMAEFQFCVYMCTFAEVTADDLFRVMNTNVEWQKLIPYWFTLQEYYQNRNETAIQELLDQITAPSYRVETDIAQMGEMVE